MSNSAHALEYGSYSALLFPGYSGKTRLLAVVGCESMELTSRSEEYCGWNAGTDMRVAERTLESMIARDDNGG